MSAEGGLRGRLEEALRRSWRGEGGAPARALALLSLPLSWIWRGVTAARNAAFDRGLLRSHRAPVPVVSVGNLAVGGTGKTPVSAWLCRELADAGARPALVARGYGEDELRLHRRWNADVPVHADPDRVAAAVRAVEGGAGVVVLDDGFQHRRLGRQLDVVLLAAEHPFPGPLLPRGPFREPPSALDRAHVAVVTRKTAPEARADALVEELRRRAPHLLLVRLDLAPDRWVGLDGDPVERPGPDVLAVTGVADPEGFAAFVEATTGARPELLAFPDHHDFDAADAGRIVRAAGPRTVVTTEKDAVKLAALAELLPEVRVLALEIRPREGADALLSRARRLAALPRGRPAG